jgi:hypothetical protein
MEVSGEGGGSVGGRVVGRLEGWGRYKIPKKINNGGQRWGQKNMIKEKTLPRKKKTYKGKDGPRRKKIDVDHEGDGFIPSMKSQNEIIWMVHWWVLGHSSPTLLHKTDYRTGCSSSVRRDSK